MLTIIKMTLHWSIFFPINKKYIIRYSTQNGIKPQWHYQDWNSPEYSVSWIKLSGGLIVVLRVIGDKDWHFDNLNSSSESESQVVHAAAIDDIKVLFKKRVEVYYQVWKLSTSPRIFKPDNTNAAEYTTASCLILKGFKKNLGYRSTHCQLHKYLDLGLVWSKKLDIKFSRVFIRYKNTHQTLISSVFSMRMISEFLNVSSCEVPLASLPGICVFEDR